MKVSVTADSVGPRGMHQEEFENVKEVHVDDDGALSFQLGSMKITYEQDEWTAFAVEKET